MSAFFWETYDNDDVRSVYVTFLHLLEFIRCHAYDTHIDEVIHLLAHRIRFSDCGRSLRFIAHDPHYGGLFWREAFSLAR